MSVTRSLCQFAEELPDLQPQIRRLQCKEHVEGRSGELRPSFAYILIVLTLAYLRGTASGRPQRQVTRAATESVEVSTRVVSNGMATPAEVNGTNVLFSNS